LEIAILPDVAMTDATQPSSVESLSLADLENACRRETKRYQHGEVSDRRFCLEIFHRALRQAVNSSNGTSAVLVGAIKQRGGVAPHYTDEDARRLLVTIYSEFIKAQINRSAVPGIPLEDFVHQVWLHFWQAANNGLTFVSLEAALAYLKQTSISTLIRQRRRAWDVAREESLQQYVDVIGEGALADADADIFARHTQQRFRARCREILTDPLEYRVFWMRYGMALPPRTIAERLAQEDVLINGRSATARSISDLVDRCCKRLCLDQEIRDLLQSD
jgi:hypothetical protein